MKSLGLWVILCTLALFIPITLIKVLALLIYTSKVSQYFAKQFFSHSPASFFWGLIISISLFSTIGSVIYFLYAWNVVMVAIVMVLVPVIMSCSIRLSPCKGGVGGGQPFATNALITNSESLTPPSLPFAGEEPLQPPPAPPSVALRAGSTIGGEPLNAIPEINLSNVSPSHWIFCIITAGFIFKLITSGSDAALRTPFEAIPIYTIFIILALASFLIFNLFSKHPTNSPLIGTTLFITVGLSLASFLVPLGFGFDPFIHKTAQEHIATHGFIEPKTPYYIGAYIVPITLSLVSSPAIIDIFDRFFIPFFAVLAIILASITLKTNSKNGAFLGALLILLLPISSFTFTTPHALALILSLLAIVSTLSHTSPIPRWILVACALVTHAYVGIPLALFIALLSLPQNKYKKYFATIILGLLIIAPAYILSCTTTCTFPQKIAVPTLPFDLNLKVPWNLPLDLMYGALATQGLAILTFIILGFRSLKKNNSQRATSFLLGIIALALASFLVAAQKVPGIVEYESGTFATRLLEIMFVFAIPLIILAGDRIQKKSMKYVSTVVLALLVTAGIFQLYPQHNSVEISRFYTVSQTDFDVVTTIKSHAEQNSYAVLAPQSTSAAALRTFGFTNYLTTTTNESQFFYPIPTSSTFYSYYLKLVNEKISHTTINDARQFMNVQKIYVVIPTYWFDAPRLHQELITISDEHFFVGTTLVTVFN